MAPANEKVSNGMPEDLAFSILSKLPVKSLKRFRCVQKSWSDLFENPHFMSMYRSNFISKYDNDNSSLLLKLTRPTFDHDDIFLLSGERFENRVKLDWPPPFQEEDDSFIYIAGSSINGTLCLYHGLGYGLAQEIRHKIVLWNPATEEFQVVPSCLVECPPGVNVGAIVHGFGYDHVRDDYKVIRYVDFGEDVNYYGAVPDSFWQIYSQRSNSWKKLDVKMTSRCPRPIGFEVFLNGVCHWWSIDDYNREEVLVSFNLSSEVFQTTPLDWHDSYEFGCRHLVVLHGSICMITKYVETTCFDISILGELGVKESWTKLFTVGPLPLPCFRHLIGVGMKGDIFFGTNDDELAWCDTSTQENEEIGVKGAASYCQIVIYKESLLPIGGINS